ncbi:MAG: DegT/DnrJ/EryC1/StrS family aminotransferase [Lewinellaceae bacterium]|nr:DegT/DnrJ/EryC1/StrS family aminotransferase [Lewinellaceae bacterium]
MVDLKTQYQELKPEIEQELQEVLDSCMFIGGPKVNQFREGLEQYLGVKHVIPCANGTDALQIAMMALGLKPGDEVIVPAFTFIATAEVIGLLGLKPVMCDVNPDTMNVSIKEIEAVLTPNTKAIVPVHLFGQCSDMAPIMELAEKHGLYVIEDNAQAIGADYTGFAGKKVKAGTIGHIGCTSFFPSKNLGCYGDGGAVMTNDDELAAKCRVVANHGQSRQYYHDEIGVNSRLDAFQAVVLNAKLKRLDKYNEARNMAADYYDREFSKIPALKVPGREPNSTHVFHQYTTQIKTDNPSGTREKLKTWLNERGIPMMIYYPVPLHKQKAFAPFWSGGSLPVTEALCESVFSIPMHSELDEDTLAQITDGVTSFFKNLS